LHSFGLNDQLSCPKALKSCKINKILVKAQMFKIFDVIKIDLRRVEFQEN
jgi:hypothetical protein